VRKIKAIDGATWFLHGFGFEQNGISNIQSGSVV
jgi:hypothetical protein